METSKLERLLAGSRIIPSVNSAEGLKCVLTKTSLPCVMLKLGDVNTLRKIVRLIHQYGR